MVLGYLLGIPGLGARGAGAAAVDTIFVVDSVGRYVVDSSGNYVVTRQGAQSEPEDAGEEAFSLLGTFGTDLLLDAPVSGIIGFSDDDPVTTIPDASSYGHDLTAHGAIYKEDIIGSFAAVRLDGTNDYLDSASIDCTARTAFAVFLVVANVASGDAGQFVEFGSDPSASTTGFSFAHTAANIIDTGMRGNPGPASSSAQSTTNNPAILVTTTPRILCATFDKALAKEEVTNWVNACYLGGFESNLTGRSADNDLTGNFGNHALYFGMRGGASLPLAYDLVHAVVVGRTLTKREWWRTHRYLNDLYDVFS